MTVQEPTITLTLEEYDHFCKEMENLKQELKTLRENLEQQAAKSFNLQAELAANRAIIVQLRWKIADLSRRLWGKSSEKRKLPEDSSQLLLCFDSPGDVADSASEEKKALEKNTGSEKGYNRFRKNFTKKITPHARKPIDPSLPREEIIVPMPEGICLEGAVKIGEEISEQYAYRPAEIYVIRTIRYQYKFPDGRIITVPAPPTPHPRSNAWGKRAGPYCDSQIL